MKRRGWLIPIALLATGVLAAPAGATTTLDQTIRKDKSGSYFKLKTGPGERYHVREEGLGRAKKHRRAHRRSIAYFSQLTDPQIADEMSPLRVELIDPAGGELSAAWRPQEAMGTYVLDQIVRGVDANMRSPVKPGKGKRAKLGFAVLTGDQPDNQQLNEVLWHKAVLDGAAVDPFSGEPIGADNPCPTASPAEQSQLDAQVAARSYTGVQDFDDYPGLPADRYQGFWDPDQPNSAGPYAAFPSYPGLMDRAQKPFNAKGLKVPWYMSRGNHDGLIQGNVPANSALFSAIAPGCQKFFPSAAVDPASIVGQNPSSLFDDPTFIGKLTAGARPVPPDPNRRLVSTPEFKQLHEGSDHGHGFDYVNAKQDSASNGYADYYAFSPAKGTRFISLDSVAIGGGANGNVDDPQYRWLEHELDRASGVSYNAKGKLVRDGDKDKLIVVYAHHTIATMDNATPDESAGPCTTPPEPGCDGDPRDSAPLHLGNKGPESVRSLLLRYPDVVLAVTGHTHHNDVIPHKRKGAKSGFWEINTASHVDWPQQSRLIEMMDNRDGTLSIFGTIVDQAAPAKAPHPGPAAGLTDRQLASISRQLAANDPQSNETTNGGGEGDLEDRNVELLVRDPRQLAR
jgi:metallophosphoesterase (TIGR03767 family)